MQPLKIHGPVAFIRGVEQAIDRLSTTLHHERLFLDIVRGVRQSRGLRFAAVMRLSVAQGVICISDQSQFSDEELCLTLAHEAYHNFIYHEYLASHGRLRARRKYWQDLAEIERRCVERELTVAQELGLTGEVVTVRRVYRELLPHQFMLDQQYAALRRLRRQLPAI